MVLAVRSIRVGERVSDFRKPQRAVPLETPIGEALADPAAGGKEAAALFQPRKPFSEEDLPNLKPYGKPDVVRSGKDMLKIAQESSKLCKDMDRGVGALRSKLSELDHLISNSKHREAMLLGLELITSALPSFSPEWRFTSCSAEVKEGATEVTEATVLQPPRIFMGLEKPRYGSTAAQRKHLRDMWRILDETIACARDMDDKSLQGHALHLLARYHLVKDEPKATKLAQDALAVFRLVKDVGAQIEVLSTLCDSLLAKGRLKEAGETAKEMLARSGPKDYKNKADALLKIAKVSMGKEDYDMAEEMAEEALQVYRLNLKDKMGQQRVLEMLLGVRLMNEGADEAFECAKELVELWQGRSGNRAMEAQAQQVLANMQLFQEIAVSHFMCEKGRTFQGLKMGQALETAKEAHDKYREVADDRHVVASICSTMVQAHAIVHEYKEAVSVARRIPPMYSELDDRLSEAGAMLQLAEIWFDKILYDVNQSLEESLESLGEEKAQEEARENIPQEEVDEATKVAMDAGKIYTELKCTEGQEAVAVCLHRFNERGLEFHKKIFPPTAKYYVMSEDRTSFKVQYEWSFTGEGEDETHKPIMKEKTLPVLELEN